MTRCKKIGYFHAFLSTAWFSIGISDTSAFVYGILGNDAYKAISWFFSLPLTWVVAMRIGFPLSQSISDHFIQMILFGLAIIMNGLLVGYCIDRFFTLAGIPDKSSKARIIQEAEHVMDVNRP